MLHFHTGTLKINIFKILLGGMGHKKEYSEYAFDNVDNSGRPLTGGSLHFKIQEFRYGGLVLGKSL